MYCTPLIWHCINSEEEQFNKKKLAQYKNQVNVSTATNTTALHFVALGSNVMLASWLIKNGIRVKSNLDGQTPLHWACKSGNVCMIEFLVKNMRKEQIHTKDMEDKTAYDWAVEHLGESDAVVICGILNANYKNVKKCKLWRINKLIKI